METPGASPGQFAVLRDDLAALHGGDVAVGGLHQTGATGREVGDEVRRMQGEAVEVDHVQVGEVARSDDASIGPADMAGRALGLLVHDLFERQQFAAAAVTCPVGDRRGRERAVADRVAVCSGVGQPEHRVR